MEKLRYLLITNRGPDFETSNVRNKAIGGTKDAYSMLAKSLSKKWICVYHGDKEGLKSEYDILDPLFLDAVLYERYYYKYVSEYLYPNLLGFRDIAISKEYFEDFKKVTSMLANKIRRDNEKNLIICDYHLFLLPDCLDQSYKINFFWFIPFLDYKEYEPDFLRLMLLSLSKCNRLFFLTEKYKENFVEACKIILGNDSIKTEVFSLPLGPDWDYFISKKANRNEFDELVKNKFELSIKAEDRVILNVSRMDFVKNVTFLVKAYEKFRYEFKDISPLLLLVLPNHRDNSIIYKLAKEQILNLIHNSPYKDAILILNESLSKKEIRILYSFSDVLACCSKYDGFPVTPMEYLLAAQENAGMLISNTIGCAEFIDCDRYIYDYNDKDSFSSKLYALLKDETQLNSEQNQKIVPKIETISLQNWIKQINNIL